jgi:ribosomal protein L11 methyltransferase
MYYIKLQIHCNSAFSEIFIAELAEMGFETFEETEKGLEAYIEEEKYNPSIIHSLEEKYKGQTSFTVIVDKIEKKNWNEEWEKNYEPIIVDDKCLIRAHFHKNSKTYPYEIIITPKMSFGTGHHQTTYLMIKNQLEIDHNNKRVMDAGCGTAILSIMAAKRGAKEVEAFDIDEWSVINGKENIEINNCNNINLQRGKITAVTLTGKFNIILANINKNVLLEEMKTYASYLHPKGLLLLSGFYTSDIPDLLKEASSHNLRELRRYEKETWASLLLEA